MHSLPLKTKKEPIQSEQFLFVQFMHFWSYILVHSTMQSLSSESSI